MGTMMLFKLGYFIKRPQVLKSYHSILSNESKGLEFIFDQQNAQLRRLICYSVENVPYYSKLFNRLNLTSEDIKCSKDLEKLPILTKEDIKKSPSSFISKKLEKYVLGSTGGSTGVPLKYRMSEECYSRGVALLYRGWGFAGYRLGEKVSTIAGASLLPSLPSFKSKMQDLILNIRHYSSYGMGEKELNQYYTHLQKWNPLFLRGYASSLYLLAKFMERNNLKLNYQIKGIFSTAEVITNNQKILIEKVFGAKVYNQYGLNDGGISAYECSMHNGMHIDFERAILEVVDSEAKQIQNKDGKILATSLYNYAMPFIRYDTGDIGKIANDSCPCGCPRPLLKEICGRKTDYLKLNGKYIGSPQLTVLMGKIDLEYYQIIQKSSNEVEVNMIIGNNFTEQDKDFIVKSFTEHVGELKINFKCLNYLDPKVVNKNKHKFIINEVCQ